MRSQAKIYITIAINTHLNLIAFFFLLGKLGHFGRTENSAILLKYPTFEGFFFHVFMGKKKFKLFLNHCLIHGQSCILLILNVQAEIQI